MANFTNNSSAISKKAASSFSLSRYKVDDKVAGYTTPGDCFRRDYKKAVRLTRRSAKLALRKSLAALVAGDD